MLVPKHVDCLRRCSDGERSMGVRHRGVAVQFEEGSKLLVGQSEVICMFVEAPSNFGVEVG